MKKYLITFGFIFIALFVNAQHGYLGKTVYIDYNGYASLAPLNPTFNSEDVSFKGVNYTHELGIHKILNRKKEINFSYGFARSAFYEYNGSAISSFNGSSDPFNSNKMHIQTFSLAFRSYSNGMFKKRWSVAPFGSYVDVKPYMSSLLLSYKANEDADLLKIRRINTFGFALGLGRQKVVFDKFTFNYGAQFAIPFKLFSVYKGVVGSNNSYSSSTTVTTPVEQYNNAAYGRLFLKTVFEIKFGFGILAF